MSTQRLQSDPVIGLRNCGRGFELPSPMKYKSRHLPSGIVSVLRATQMHNNNDGAGSVMEICTDSDDEVNSIQCSLNSSPQDDKIANANGNCRVHSEFSSSMEKIQQKPRGGAYISNGYYSSSRLEPNVKTVDKQGFCGHGLKNNNVDDNDAPSAPPLACSVQEINTVAEIFSTFRPHGTPCPGNSSASSTMNEVNTSRRTSAVSSCSVLARLPTYHASGLGPWYAVISYDACVRLCLQSWARGCLEAPIFLENECALLRNAFSLQNFLLQPEEELLRKRSSELVSEEAALKPKRTFGKMKVQVRKVKMALDPPTGCSFTSLKLSKAKLESLRFRMSKLKSTLSTEWHSLRKVCVTPHIPSEGSFSSKSFAYCHAGTRYLIELSGLVKTGVTTFRNSSSSCEVVEETYSCSLKLKSSSEEDAVRMQPGSNETHLFLPDGLGDDLVINVFDSKGKYYGRVVAQVADIAEDPGDKLRWWPIYHEPDHELVGRIQLYIHYSTIFDDNSHLKCGPVAETVAYDLVLEASLKAQHIQQRNLLIHGSWRWLVTEFGLYYGVSDSYTKLRYLSYVMDVATPTADCLNLVHELLLPVVMKGTNMRTLSHQENRILGEVSVQIEQTIALVFENYKSLDESSPSGMTDVFRPASGLAPPALAPALKLYALLHDILSSEARLKLCKYFQTAVNKRFRMHLAETDELVSSNCDNSALDPVALSTAYQKMISLCFSIRNEIFTDIEIHNQHLLPSFVDLPNISSSIYSTGLCNRLRAFLEGYPPNGPTSPVTELVRATVDFQRDLSLWNISLIKGGVDAKELFHLYIIRWIQEKRLALLELCKLDKVRWSVGRTQPSTNPFVDDIYDRLKETLVEYEVIVHLWPAYAFALESAIADVERAIMEILDKYYADVLSPLKDNTIPIKIGLKYVQKIATGNVCTYTVPDELGVLMNSMKRMLDVLRPKIESQLKLYASCIADSENNVPGDRLSEVTVMLRTKFKNYLQAVVEKLAENTRSQNATKLKKIIQEAKESVSEFDIQSRMQPLKDMVTKTIVYLHGLFETRLFLIICRGFWDRMGQDVLRVLQNRKDNMGCYKGLRVALTILDDMFASQIQKLLGNALQEKDLQPPRSIMEVRSMLCKDAGTHKHNDYYY